MNTTKYIDDLKNTELRPKKIKLREGTPEILLEQEIHDKIIDFFMQKSQPSDDEIHAFAKKEGVDPHEFEGNIYMILGDILSGGKSSTFTGSYNSKELALGIKIEGEHINMKNKKIAEKIAKDHLAEIPDYYTRLEKMESAAGVKESKDVLGVY